jgi:Asp-tRNA(Asn)/Glu-tRNA(Gln) amidotransferase A subunit family amidase
MNKEDLRRLSISEAKKLLETKELSAVELTTVTLDHIKEQEPTINAFITITEELH